MFVRRGGNLMNEWYTPEKDELELPDEFLDALEEAAVHQPKQTEKKKYIYETKENEIGKPWVTVVFNMLEVKAVL